MNMRFRSRPGTAHILIAIAAMGGCTERSPAGPQAALAPPRSPDLFAAAVGYFADGTQGPIRVDPRPLRPEAALGSVTERDLMPLDAETIHMRTRVIESAGWRTADAPRDWRCVFSQGLPPAQPRPLPDSLRLHREACLSGGPYVSLAFGIPQSGTDLEHPDRWRIRAMRMLSYGYEVVDLHLLRDPDGGWRVVEARVRSGVFS